MISLKNVLLINGISSGATGLLLVSFSVFISGIFGITNPSVSIGVGVFLLLFSAFVVLVGVQTPIKSTLVKVIAFLDILWVLASLIILVLQPLEITLIGSVLIFAVALWVTLMSMLQVKYVAQSVA